MSSSNSRALAFVSVLLTATIALPLKAPPSTLKKSRKNPKPATTAAPVSTDPVWGTFDRLVSEAKFSEAAGEAKRLRESAIIAKNDDLWERAMLEEARLRDRMGESSESLRLIRDEKWPATKRSRIVQPLLQVAMLQSYLNRYRYEIRNRERIDSKDRLPIEKMTAEQLFQESAQVLQKLWAERATWGDQANDTLPLFVHKNTYPKEIRGTVRDTITYLAVSVLSDTSNWSPADSNETTQLSVDRLLESTGPEMPGLADSSVHPLLRASVALRDLESWHRGGGRLEAALEAKLERYRRVRAAVAEGDRKLVTDALEKRLTAFKKVGWWAAGMADLANYRRAEGRLREAFRIASEGVEEFEDTPGGQRCLNIQKEMQQPRYTLSAMQVDAAKKRSILVKRTNVKKLYFRAYALTTKQLLDDRVGRWNVLPTYEYGPPLLKKKPDAAWEIDFAEAHDYGEHQSFVTPPMETPGVYYIVAALNPAFDVSPNISMGTVFQVSDFVLTRETTGEGPIIFTMVRGANGEPVPGAKVELFNFNWDGKPFKRLTKMETDKDGRCTFSPTQSRDSVFAVGEVRDGKNAQGVIDPEVFSAYQRTRAPKQEQGYFYTDRAIYRPKQSIQWKLVVVRSKPGSADLAVVEAKSTKVELHDGNGDLVQSVTVKTDAYGSAAGKFEIPAGRLLGSWSLRTSDNNSWGNVRVEEYKRPTFEVTIAGAKEAVRLNKPAVVEGEARYYFGMPLSAGQVKWHVTRQPVMPAWWGWCGWGYRRGGFNDQTQTIAAGIATVDENGKFRIQFFPKADERSQNGDDAVFNFTVAADITDAGGETRSASRSYRLGAASIQTTIEPSAPFFVEGDAGELRLQRSNLDGEPKKGTGTWRILALSGSAIMPADMKPSRRTDLPRMPKTGREDTIDADETLPRWSTYDGWQSSLANLVDGNEVFRGTVDHGDDGRAVVALPKLQPGAYRLRYDAEDEFGKKIRSWRDLVVVPAKGALPVPAMLEIDRSSVQPGDKLRVLATTGFEGQPFFFETIRDGIVQKRERVLGGENPIREIPIADTDRGGFTVAFTMMRDHQLIRLTRDIFVPWSDRDLKVSFESFRDKMRPGGKETWTLRVKGPALNGKEAAVASAQVLAFMYDKSLDAFAAASMPSPLSLLPSHTGSSTLQSPLGASNSFSLRSDPIVAVPSYPYFQPDAFDNANPYDDDGFTGSTGRGSYARDRRRAPEQELARSAAPAMAKAKKDSNADDAAASSLDQKPEPLAEAGKNTLAPRQQAGLAPPPGPGAKVEVRSNFAETAFWFPQLLSGADGSVKLQFTVPDSVTQWRVLAQALTKDVKYGQAETSSRSVKDLMVRPYLPRFIREGDTMTLRVAVNNAGDKPLEGTVRLAMIDPDTQKSVAKDFGLSGETSKSFSVGAGKGTDVRFPLKAPNRVGSVAVRVVAEAGDLSDGELRPMPLLPSRLHLVQSRFATLRDGEKRTLKFEELAKNDDRSRIDEQMVLTLDGQLFNGVLKALPYLAKYPYECIEQTVNRFISSSLVASTLDKHPAIARAARAAAKRATPYIPWDQVDPNRKLQLEETPWVNESRGGKIESNDWVNLLEPGNVRRERDSSLEKLAKAQKADGGFPWFSGGPSSTHVTLYVLNGLARAVESGTAVPRDMVRKAWVYTAAEVRRDYLPYLRRLKTDQVLDHAALLAFVATSFPDASWTEGGLTTGEVKELVDIVFAHWKIQPKTVKAYLAWTLKRLDRLADGRLVFASVLDAAKYEKDRGTFWQPEDRAWLWYNDTIESHAFLLRTALEMEPQNTKIDGMALWLFLNRKLTHWKSTRATAEAIYALLRFVASDRTLGETERYAITAGDLKEEVTFAADAVDTSARFVIPGSKIDPKTSSSVTFESKSRAFAMASATWHFSTEKLPKESASDFFSVTRTYFRRENTPKGQVLKPLEDGAKVSVGDQIEVQMSLKTKHEAEYVHLRDPRGAGFEPEGAVSGYHWDNGVGWYEEYRDSATNFFFERLPAGEYPFRYRLRAATAGNFRVGPATVQSMYAPEFAAYSAGTMMIVRD